MGFLLSKLTQMPEDMGSCLRLRIAVAQGIEQHGQVQSVDLEEQTKCLAKTFQVEKEQKHRSLAGACLMIFEERQRSHRSL